MSHIHILIFLLAALIALPMFFSIAEAALLSVNRYRIRHLVRQNNSAAKRVQQLLDRPDRMLGVILLCGTFADIAASALATLIALHYWGEHSVFVITIAMTALILIFGEIAPKTLATIYPQQIAFICAWPLLILQKVFYPLVWFANTVANGLLRIFGVKVKKSYVEHFTHQELTTILHEAGGRIPADYLAMLLKVLDLENVYVEDIMVPRNEIVGIDLSEDWDDILEQLTNSQYTRLPLYDETIDNVRGMLHVRKALNLLADENLNKQTLIAAAEEIYFIPEGTALNVQLLNFRHKKQRIGFVVSEYGDILGLVALEDILEEIVGEFTTDIASMMSKLVHPQPDGSYLVDGGIYIRDLNHILHCHFSSHGPKTLSGLIIEYLEMIPSAPLALQLNGIAMEVVQVKDNVVRTVRIFPPLMSISANQQAGNNLPSLGN